MIERSSATSTDGLRAACYAAIADAHDSLVTLADACSRTLAEIAEMLQADHPDRAASISADVDGVKAGARALAGTAIDLIWKQQPFAREFENILTMYELANDYQRLAGDLAALAADVLQADRTTLLNAPPHLRDLADTALRVSENLYEGLRDRTAGPLLRANTARVTADAIYIDGITELQHALLNRNVTAERGCSLLVILMAFQAVIRQAATTARHGRTFLAEIA
jgi:hypothetical protein